MSDRQQWSYDTRGREYWTLHRGWRVSVYEIHMGWHWAIIRGVGAGGVESDRAAAEAAAIAEVDRIMGP